jgi:hypothetical protein
MVQDSRPGRRSQFSAEDRRPEGVRVILSLDEKLISTIEQIRRGLTRVRVITSPMLPELDDSSRSISAQRLRRN